MRESAVKSEDSRTVMVLECWQHSLCTVGTLCVTSARHVITDDSKTAVAVQVHFVPSTVTDTPQQHFYYHYSIEETKALVVGCLLMPQCGNRRSCSSCPGGIVVLLFPVILMTIKANSEEAEIPDTSGLLANSA